MVLLALGAGVKLNVGCGRDIREDWVNLDREPGAGVDIVADISEADLGYWREDWGVKRPWTADYADTFDEIECSHILEHVGDLLAAAENLWLVAKPGCVLTVRCPHGASDDADEDPTHVRRMFPGSFGYLGQPHYWRVGTAEANGYGYCGDWRCDRITLIVAPDVAMLSVAEASRRIMRERNVVREMVAELVAVKPARPAQRDLIAHPSLELARG